MNVLDLGADLLPNALSSALAGLLVPAPAAITLEQILDKIGPLLIALFFFIIPIVRAIKESRDKQRQARERGEPMPEASQEDPGRKAWDDLLRGDAPVPTSPPPLVASARVEAPRRESVRVEAPRSEPESSMEPGALTPSLSGRLSDLAPAPTEDEEEASLDEERLARDQNERMLREEYERRAAFLRQERSPPGRRTAAPIATTSRELATLAPEVAEPVAARRPSMSGLGIGTDRAALRRALIAAEVLGRPVALREAGDGIGPISMRR